MNLQDHQNNASKEMLWCIPINTHSKYFRIQFTIQSFRRIFIVITWIQSETKSVSFMNATEMVLKVMFFLKCFPAMQADMRWHLATFVSLMVVKTGFMSINPSALIAMVTYCVCNAIWKETTLKSHSTKILIFDMNLNYTSEQLEAFYSVSRNCHIYQSQYGKTRLHFSLSKSIYSFSNMFHFHMIREFVIPFGSVCAMRTPELRFHPAFKLDMPDKYLFMFVVPATLYAQKTGFFTLPHVDDVSTPCCNKNLA